MVDLAPSPPLDKGTTMEHLYELQSNRYRETFHIKQCAEVFRQIYGGEIHEVQVQVDSDSKQKERELQME